MKITIISFSGRKNGNCASAARVIEELYKAGSDLKSYYFSDITISPCGKCDNECFGNEKPCPCIDDSVYEIYERLNKSDLAYFIVPNYCDYPNAMYFAFNERSQVFFQHHPERLERYLEVPKRFVVISNTGTDNFETAFEYQVHMSKKPDILFLSAKKYGKVSIAGDIMTVPDARKDLEDFCHE